MRPLILCATLAGIASGQAMIEHAVIVGGGATAAAGSGKAIGNSLQKSFGGLAGALGSAAQGGAKPSPFGESTRRANELPSIPDSVERERVSAMPTRRRQTESEESPNVIQAKTAPVAPKTQTVEPGEAVAVVRKAGPTAEDFKSVTPGTEVAELVAKLGSPSARFTMFEDGHANETLRWENRTGLVARIKSVDGKIVSVETPN